MVRDDTITDFRLAPLFVCVVFPLRPTGQVVEKGEYNLSKVECLRKRRMLILCAKAQDWSGPTMPSQSATEICGWFVLIESEDCEQATLLKTAQNECSRTILGHN